MTFVFEALIIAYLQVRHQIQVFKAFLPTEPMSGAFLGCIISRYIVTLRQEGKPQNFQLLLD